MKNNHRRERLLFWAASLLLASLTLLLLSYSALFFSSLPVRMQIQAWVAGPAAESLAAPADSQQAGSGAPLGRDRLSQAVPTLIPTAQVTADSEPAQYRFERAVVSEPPEPLPTVVEEKKKPSQPEGDLIIAALGIEAPLAKVAVHDGHWDVAELDQDVGWLETTGTTPGDQLAMVLIGHVTLPYPGGPGPFLNLHTLKVGDEIHYRTEGAVYVYQVGERVVVGPNAVEAVYVADGDRLILITCTGWNAIDRRYDRRLLIEANLVKTEPLTRSTDG
jgi:LPXTG-site transpeptidase (sortase) family protein